MMLSANTKPPIPAEAEMSVFCLLYIQRHCLPIVSQIPFTACTGYMFAYFGSNKPQCNREKLPQMQIMPLCYYSYFQGIITLFRLRYDNNLHS